jgi:ubiquitin C-terminal hydrolase
MSEEHKNEYPIEVKGIVGIQNMGNTCYCNATLQLIRTCPEWNYYCLTTEFNKSESDPNKMMLLAYQDILKSLWSAYRPAYIRPLGFISEIRKAVQGTPYEMFGGTMPNDSHEFLVYLLDHFHEALNIKLEFKDKEIPEHVSSIDRMRIMGENGWNSFVSKNNSEIVKLFFGMIRKSITCTNCNNVTYRWEVFNSLKIPCQGTTFEEWIKNEVNEESIIELYKCDFCKEKHNANIKSHIWKLPKCLFITINRFNYNGHKNMTTCPYDGNPLSFSKFFAKESEYDNNCIYELLGISDHHGTHIGGHYTTQFKHPITGDWWLFDDQNTHQLAHPTFSSSNYILFFRGKN